MPFEVPEGWVWSTLGEYFNLQAGKFISAEGIHTESVHYPYRCYGGNGIRGYVSTFNRNGDYPIIGRQGALCGNVNYASGEFYATEHAVVVESFCGTDSIWAKYLLEQLNLNQYATATAQPGLSVKTINEVAIPIPPVGEQCRISDALTRCLDIINNIHLSCEDLRISVTQTKSRVLDLAIHGKLVPQNPSDEPAINLLRRINPGFQPSDNLHYEGNLPKGWELCHLEDVCGILDFQRRPINANERAIRNAYGGAKYPYYGATGQVGTIDDYLFDGNFILLGEDGAPFLDKNSPKAYSVSGKIWVNNHAHILSPKCNGRYLLYFLNSLDYRSYVTGTTRLKLTQEAMRRIVIALPPIKEQARIVGKIDTLFDTLEMINAS